MESIDRLLAELRAEYQESQKKYADLNSQPMVQPQPSLQGTAAPSSQAIKTSGKNLDGDNLDSDLAQIKAEYQAQEQAEEVAKQEGLLAENGAQNKAQKIIKQQQQEVEVKTRREKVRQAQVWLKNLSKDSDERFWFDQFAFKYSSRIDAAIDYLQVVNEFD